MGDDINLLDALAVAEGVQNAEIFNNPLSFHECEDLGEIN